MAATEITRDVNSVADIFESMSYGPAPEATDVVQVGYSQLPIGGQIGLFNDPGPGSQESTFLL